jgi:uroporphyrinogen-III decarboxylase
MHPKENLLRAIRREDPEWVPAGMEATVRLMPPVVERPTSTGYDVFRVHWSYEPGAEGGTYPTAGGHTIDDIHRWRDQIHVPDLSSLDWSGVEEQARAIDREQMVVAGFVEMGLFERSYLLLGMEEALVAYLTAPDEMSALLGVVADYKVELIRQFHEHIELDMVWYGDDWGTQDRLFLPPGVWREVVKPHTQRIYACMQARGILIDQHSCGKIEAVFGDVVEMGADVWNPCQPCNDLARLKRAYGERIAFCGGIDSQFVLNRPGVTPDEVRAEVRRRIDDLAPGGGYLAAPSHSVPYDPAILEAMRDEIAVHGRAIYCQ